MFQSNAASSEPQCDHQMVERVEAALKAEMRGAPFVSMQANGPAGEMQMKLFFNALARAAIEAMRPSEEMKDAGKIVIWQSGNVEGELDSDALLAGEVFDAMIDAALGKADR